MCEILFRGKRKDNREWVEGFLVKKIDPLLSIESWFILVQEYDTSCIDGKPTLLESLMTWYEVIPETISIFSGLYDKNGERIFKGSIVKYTPRVKISILYEVVWQESMSRFSLKTIGSGINLYEWLEKDKVNYCCEVIGNIYDNPELLKDYNIKENDINESL